MIGLTLFTVLIWFYDLAPGSNFELIALNILYVVLTVIVYKHPAGGDLGTRMINVALVVLLVSLMAFELSKQFEQPWLNDAGLVFFVSAPSWGLMVWSVRTKPLLYLGFVPAAIGFVLFLIQPLIPEEMQLNYFLFSIMIVSVYGALWVVLARFFLRLAERWRSHNVWGPLTEFIALLFLFAPSAVLILVLTDLFTQGPTALTIAAVFIGLIFSNVVGTPLRRFVVALGKLGPRRERSRVVSRPLQGLCKVCLGGS